MMSLQTIPLTPGRLVWPLWPRLTRRFWLALWCRLRRAPRGGRKPAWSGLSQRAWSRHSAYLCATRAGSR